MRRLLPIHRFGWAFLLAWVFCVFYTQVVEGYTGSTAMAADAFGLPLRLFFMGLPVLFSVLTLVVLVRFEKQIGSPIDHARLQWIAPLLTAASCPFLFIQVSSLELTMAMFALGAVLTGIGSGLMWVMWGEYYAKISQEDVEFLAPVSVSVAAVLVLIVSSMSGWVSLVLVMCFPLLSGLCLMLSWRKVQEQVATAEHSGIREQQLFKDTHAHAVAHPWAALKVMGRAGFGILVACLFVCLLGSFWHPSDETLIQFQVIIVVSIAFMVIVALVSAKGPQRISVSFLFRWMCPFLVLGFVVIIIWGDSWGTYLAYMISTAARFSFCLITQMFFAQYVTSGRTSAVQAYGFGWIFVHLGDFLGVLSIVFLQAALAEGAIATYEIAAVSIAVLTILTMFILNRAGSDSLARAEHPFEEVAPLGVAGDKDSTEPLVLAEKSAKTSDGTIARATTEADVFKQRIRTIAKEQKLTPREVEVFELLARGRSVPFIRDTLVISRDTAATHVKHIYTKLGVHSRQELIDLTQAD